MSGEAIDFVEVMKNIGQLFQVNELTAFREEQIKEGARLTLKHDEGEVSVDIVYDEYTHRLVLGCQIFTLPERCPKLLELYQVLLSSNVYWSGMKGQGSTIGVLPGEGQVFLCKHYTLPFFDLMHLKAELEGFAQCCRTWCRALAFMANSN
jgi:hypothetical protein